MRKRLFAGLFFFLASVGIAQAQDPGWPRQVTSAGNTIVYYQPQVDSWQAFTQLKARMAVSVTPSGGTQAIGVVDIHAHTGVDSDTQMVAIDNLIVTKGYFPSLDPATAAKMTNLVRSLLPHSTGMSLHRLVAATPKPATAPPGVQLNNTPPWIQVSYQPAILLSVQGVPAYAAIPDSKLEYVINTNWSLFRYKKNDYYLLVGSQWMTAPQLDGPWKQTSKLPKDMEKLPQSPQWAGLKNFIPPSSTPDPVVPTVFYSTVPAEVVLFDGQPVYSAIIPGTQLLYATNTPSNVFVYSLTEAVYYLTAGRWFTANSLQGPWTYASMSLPPDFANIPESSPAARVLSSVPGTEEAKDAVLLAQVPTTIVVNPNAAAAKVKVSYDGAPQFSPITGTSLAYATNTPQKVIGVGDLYYLCQQGLWFVSVSPTGPWQTAQFVPQEIYTIPTSSPVYNVTYVTQAPLPNGTIQSSYTAGYLGAFIVGASVGAIVAGGTGYYYPPYINYVGFGYPAYYPCAATYGYAGYYHTATGAYGVSQTVYGPYGSATRSASYNPYTGTYGHSASVSTPYGRESVGSAYNPYTGAAGATRQGSNAYGSWGSSVVSKGNTTAYSQHVSNAYGSAGAVEGSHGGAAVGSSTAYGNSVAGRSSNGDLYAGHDGNAYKNTGSGWQKYSNGGWNSVDSHSSGSFSGSSFDHDDSMQGMQSDFQNRQRGASEDQSFQGFQHSSGWGSRGGGGFRR
jgi:hypothetical protein